MSYGLIFLNSKESRGLITGFEIFLACLIFMLLATPLQADKLFLKDGRVIEGKNAKVHFDIIMMEVPSFNGTYILEVFKKKDVQRSEIGSEDASSKNKWVAMRERLKNRNMSSGSSGAASGSVSFNRDIKPILETKCVNCHGEETQKGGLRLDTRSLALKGGDQGASFVPGNAKESLLYQVVMLDESDDEHMPAKGEPLTADEKESLKQWLNSGASWFGKLKPRKAEVPKLKVPEPATRQELLNNTSLQLEHSRQIDELINTYLKSQGIKIERPASDQVFLRRAYLDIGGRIPTLQEYESFMSNRSSGKRNALVDELVESPAYVSQTMNQWLDTLRVKYHNLKVQTPTYIMWIRNAIKDNMPYDDFVKAQLTAKGSVYDPSAAAGYFVRDRLMPEDRVAATMEVFLGTSMVCAQCHDHPLAEWTQMDFYKLMAFFGGVKIANGGSPIQADLELAKKKGIKASWNKALAAKYGVLGDRVLRGGFGAAKLPSDYQYKDGKPGEWVKADVPFGPKVSINYKKTYDDPDEFISNKSRKKLKKSLEEFKDVNSRAEFAQWATSPKNPMFTKTIVNRLWHRAFGIPLVGELTDISLEDMGKSPQLTIYLVQLMKNIAYDQKLFMKIIYKTQAYQRVAFDMPAYGEMPLGAPVVTRLSAEQVWDSILTLRRENPDEGVLEGSLERRGANYTEMIRLDGIKRLQFAMKGKFSSQVAKELNDSMSFGKPSISKRASLLPAFYGPATFFGMFGRAQRETIDDSVREPTIPQVLYLMNGAEVASLMQRKAPGIKTYTKQMAKPSEAINRARNAKFNQQSINWVYQAVLSRSPKSNELRVIQARLKNAKEPIADLFWALINTNEFKMKM